MERQFVYSVIADGAINNTAAYGGHYGDTAGSTVPGNATQDTAGVAGEITSLNSLKSNIIAGLTTPSTTYTFPANFTSYSSSGTWYEIPDGSSGVVRLSAETPSDVFYIYNSGDMDLQGITFILSGNPQTYNIYFVSGGLLTLGGTTYGNFIANQVNVPVKTTVYGSVSALTADVGGGGKLTVYMGCPQYDFTYVALSITYGLVNVTLIGGKYSPTPSDPAYNDLSQSELDSINWQSELTSLNSFRDETVAFLNNPIYTMNDITTTGGYIYPISTNNWYYIRAASNIVITFMPVTKNDVFYIVTMANDMNLANVTFNLNNASVKNIYFISNKNIYLSQSTNYGNFICNISIFAPENKITVQGTLSVITATNSVLVEDLGSYFVTVIFPVDAQCFMKGTKILTDRWYVPVEELKEGDMVITHGEICNNGLVVDADTMPIVHIHKYTCAGGVKTSPIVIKQNAYAPNKPFEDLYVSRNHRMIDRKGRLYPASKYVNGNTIYQDPSIETITYYHIELASHYAITANGVMVESYNTPPRLRPICAPPNAPQ